MSRKNVNNNLTEPGIAIFSGYAFQKARRCIEQAKPDNLYDICGDSQRINKDRLSELLKLEGLLT